jgi:hypothetical protein
MYFWRRGQQGGRPLLPLTRPVAALTLQGWGAQFTKSSDKRPSLAGVCRSVAPFRWLGYSRIDMVRVAFLVIALATATMAAASKSIAWVPFAEPKLLARH